MIFVFIPQSMMHVDRKVWGGVPHQHIELIANIYMNHHMIW